MKTTGKVVRTNVDPMVQGRAEVVVELAESDTLPSGRLNLNVPVSHVKHYPLGREVRVTVEPK